MVTDSGKLTVYFEDPFWVGVFEKEFDGKLSVSKITFGSEPKDHEVLNFILYHYHELRFSSGVELKKKISADNPKRRQRNARKQISAVGIGTKSQQALKLQYDEMKNLKKQIRKERAAAEKQRMFELKQQKKKEKRKGH